MPVRWFVVIVAAIFVLVSPAVAGDKGTAANGSNVKKEINAPSLRQILEFLGEWETDEGQWIDPTDTDWLIPTEQESKRNESNQP